MKTMLSRTQATVARKSEPFFSKKEGGEFFQPGRSIQRKCAHCEQEEKVQKKEVGGGGVLQKQDAGTPDAGVPGAGAPAAGGAAPVATPKTCGPDVSSNVAGVWAQIQTDFAGWSPTDKLAASLYLILPFVPAGGGVNPRSAGGAALFSGSWAEPFADLLAPLLDVLTVPGISALITSPSSSWELNRDAFDTKGLFILSADWLLNLPGCGEPHCSAIGSGGLPRGYSDPCEDPASCGLTVQMGSSCWLSGTVNYGAYGIMMKEAYKWCDAQRSRLLSLLPVAVGLSLISVDMGIAYIRSSMDDHEIAAAFLKELFSAASMVIYAGGYKLWDEDDPVFPVLWALATYSGGPSAKAPGTNRPGCATGCAQTGSAFGGWDYVWEPVKHRKP